MKTALTVSGQTASTPWATWGNGIILQGNFRESAINILGPDGAVVFEIKPNSEIWRNGQKIL